MNKEQEEQLLDDTIEEQEPAKKTLMKIMRQSKQVGDEKSFAN